MNELNGFSFFLYEKDGKIYFKKDDGSEGPSLNYVTQILHFERGERWQHKVTREIITLNTPELFYRRFISLTDFLNEYEWLPGQQAPEEEAVK